MVCFVLSLLLFLGACTSTRPVLKIGLLAPFEGLYRHTGYEALAAMRAAIAETESGAVDLMPLALDTSADPVQTERAMAKVLQDPAVFAVVGPLSPAALDAGTAELLARLDRWFPYPAWPPLDSLLARAAQDAAARGAHRIVLVAPDPGALALPMPSGNLGAAPSEQDEDEIPIALLRTSTEVRADDVVVWLGDAAAGASFLAQLRRRHPDVPFWTTTVGGDPVFYQRAAAALYEEPEPLPLGPVFWTAALDDGYETWAAGHVPNSPTAYAVYRATQRAVAAAAGARTESLPQHLFVFRLAADGSSLLTEPPAGQPG